MNNYDILNFLFPDPTKRSTDVLFFKITNWQKPFDQCRDNVLSFLDRHAAIMWSHKESLNQRFGWIMQSIVI
jgi:hypothetical protein